MEERISHNESAKKKNEQIRDDEMGKMEDRAEKGGRQK